MDWRKLKRDEVELMRNFPADTQHAFSQLFEMSSNNFQGQSKNSLIIEERIRNAQNLSIHNSP